LSYLAVPFYFSREKWVLISISGIEFERRIFAPPLTPRYSKMVTNFDLDEIPNLLVQ
jgi:hypothetical protein